jgi:hypothetical protein
MFGMKILLCSILAGVCLGTTGVSPSYCDTASATRAYLRLNSGGHEGFSAAIKRAERNGAALYHRFYPYAAIGEIPRGSADFFDALPGVQDVYVDRIAPSVTAGMSEHERHVAEAFNELYFPIRAHASSASPAWDETETAEPVRIDPGPLEIPREYLEDLHALSGDATVPAAPPATSEFFLGHVAVGVIMPESDGIGTHDWTAAEEGKMVEEVLSAMEFWVKHAPENNLRFTYEMNYRVPVRVEPLDRGGWTIEDKWAGQSLESMGFEGRNHFSQSYQYIDIMKDRYDTDWGFIIFLLHGREGQSFGSFLAYAYLGGPFNVNISANGRPGPDNLDRVIAHETGHTFYTLDEYLSSPHDCSARSGYLDVVNANKINGGPTCELNIPCIMRGADPSFTIDDLPPCVYTKGQVGWWDTDEDGIPDVLDTDPVVESVALDDEDAAVPVSGDTLYASAATFRGVAASVPLTNMNMRSDVSPRHVTIESVGAQYRLDGGPWMACRAVDGDFDDPTEEFIFTLEGLSQWAWHSLEVRAVTAHGNVTPDSLTASVDFFVAPPLGGDPVVQLACSNPTRPPVSVAYAPMDQAGREGSTVPVVVAVYDVMGRRVATLASGNFVTGRFYRAEWDGLDSNGERMPAGVYMIAMSSDGRTSAGKVLIVP